MDVGIIILAAGPSSRMGSPKQLLQVNGKSMLSNAIASATASRAKPVIVVLGANHESMTGELSKEDCVRVIINADWTLGLSSSIKTGLKTLLSICPAVEGVILTLCDQPYVSAQYINQLIDERIRRDKPIVASSYAHTSGPPALFSKEFFPHLFKLEQNSGAKKIIADHQQLVALVSFPEGSIDIDTPGDYENFSCA